VSSSKHSSRATGSGSSPSRVTPPRKTTPIITGRRKKQKKTEAETQVRKYKRAYRVRKNVLGDMDTFFGGSSGPAKKRVVKKPTTKTVKKPALKLPQKRKTPVKRGRK